MSLLTRLKMGLVLTKDSVLLIRHHPRLALFPIVSGIAGLVFLALFLGIAFGIARISPEGGVLVGLLVIYFGLTFISTFFTAGLVHQTRSAIGDGTVSLEAGLAAAWERKTPIAIWSIIAATVGILINMIESSDSRVARLFGAIFGVAWTLMTFFIVPVIVFERTSTKGMFKRSAGTFKETYGETPVSLIAIQLVSLAVAVPFVLVAFGLFSTGIATVAIPILLVGIGLSFIVTQTLQGVVKTSLYLYASEGIKPSEFDDVDFDDLARVQDRRGGVAGAHTTSGGWR